MRFVAPVVVYRDDVGGTGGDGLADTTLHEKGAVARRKIIIYFLAGACAGGIPRHEGIYAVDDIFLSLQINRDTA